MCVCVVDGCLCTCACMCMLLSVHMGVCVWVSVEGGVNVREAESWE